MGTMNLRNPLLSKPGDPERDANKVLDTMWGESLPVDPVQIAKRVGLKVFVTPLEPRISGAIVKEPGEDVTILLSADDSKNRQRFTCAHELGHYICRGAFDDDEFSYVDYRGDLAAAGTDKDEIYANQFAAALLMPADILKSLRHSGLEPFQLADRFGVSLEAMNFRLRNLGIL